MEFIAVFLVSLLVLFILVAGVLFGRPPVYQPEREDVLALLQGIGSRSTTEAAWGLFIHTPITHDPELESFRQRCYQFDQGEVKGVAARQGINGYLYDMNGRSYIQEIASELDRFIRNAPLSIDF
ncbi:hypothetical protein [Amphritea japonica]|uniref:Uncharacterized protein n=1 Tax=Amphritea japonica ATCC BAA-1530 TaxID=1278309 RepID=A0A7R6PG41_9GAMM|nr:hypothetical protein [Amphritea japonica]BBB27626.1 conserved hypothetical protein [Amphritea japonica ATCC BAA-1530]